MIAQTLKNQCQPLQHRPISHTHHLSRGTSRVSKRTENVKNGANSNLAPGRSSILHGWMECRGKHETYPHLLYAPPHLLGTQVNLDSQCFQHVGAATPAAHGTVTVLGYLEPGTSSNKSCRSGYIECPGVITSSTDNVNHRVGYFHLNCLSPHDAGQPGNFICRLPFNSKGGDKGTELSRSSLAPHYLFHNRGSFLHSQRTTRYQCLDSFFNHFGLLLQPKASIRSSSGTSSLNFNGSGFTYILSLLLDFTGLKGNRL